MSTSDTDTPAPQRTDDAFDARRSAALASFDPDGATTEGSGVFGLPFDRSSASVVIIPAPFDATCSQHGGTADGPEAIREASCYVDLLDRRFGRVYERGIFMEPSPHEVRTLSDAARREAAPLMARGGATADDRAALDTINSACRRVNEHVHDRVIAALEEGKFPGVVGGEHGVSFGAIKACAQRVGPLAVLQFDAHMDLRVAYGGLTWSHASVMYNTVREIPGITRLVQVGIRDHCPAERAFAERRDASGGQLVRTFYDDDMFDETAWGTPFGELCERVIESLPRRVWVTFDIDALDPSLCPNTGTPVPGGMGFQQASLLIQMLRDSDRDVVGFDLVEVCPRSSERADWPEDWDANVGARILYRLCSLAPE